MTTQKRDGIDLDANGREELAQIIAATRVLIEGDHAHLYADEDGTLPFGEPDDHEVLAIARAVIAAGWVSPAAVAGRDAELADLREQLEHRNIVALQANAERDGVRAVLGEVAALADDARKAAQAPDVYDPSWQYVSPVVSASAIAAVLAPVSGAVEDAGAAPVDLDADWLSYDADAIHGINVGLTEAHEAFDAAYFRSTTGSQMLSNVEQTMKALSNLRDRLSAHASPVAGHEQEVRAEAWREGNLAGTGDMAAVIGWGARGADPDDRPEKTPNPYLAARSSGSSAPVQGGAE